MNEDTKISNVVYSVTHSAEGKPEHIKAKYGDVGIIGTPPPPPQAPPPTPSTPEKTVGDVLSVPFIERQQILREEYGVNIAPGTPHLEETKVFAPTPPPSTATPNKITTTEPTSPLEEGLQAVSYFPSIINPFGPIRALFDYMGGDHSLGAAVGTSFTLPGAMLVQKEGFDYTTPTGETVTGLGAGQLPLIPEAPSFDLGLPDIKDAGKWIIVGIAALAGVYILGKVIGRKK